MAGEDGKKLATPDDMDWFILFLCSRWGRSKFEIESLPASEVAEHWAFWKEYKWGMSDDLASIQIAHNLQRHTKSTIKPWMIKQWTTQRDYTYRLSQLIVKPVSAIRSEFFAILNALKGNSDG